MIGSEFIELHARKNKASIFIRACEVDAFEQGVREKRKNGDTIQVPNEDGCTVYFCGKSVAVEEDCGEVMQLVREAEM